MTAATIAAVATGVGAAASLGTGIASATSQSDASQQASDQSNAWSMAQSVNNAYANAQARSDFSPYMSTGGQANATLAGLLGLTTADTLQRPDIASYQTQVFTGQGWQTVTNQAAYDEALRNYRTQKAQLQQLQNSGQLGSLTRSYGMDQYRNDPGYTPMVNSLRDLQQTPGYQFQLQQGQQSALNSAAARGSLLSGGSLKALERFGQGLASTSYNDAWNRAQTAYANAFNRNTTQQNNLYSRLSGVSNSGLNAAQSAANVATSNNSTQNQNLQNNSNSQQQAAYNQGNANSNLASSINSTVQGTAQNYLLTQLLGKNNAKQSITGAVGGNLSFG